MNTTLAEARLVCRALTCSRPVFLEGRCRLHYMRQCEREEVAAAAAEREATKDVVPVKEKPSCTVRDCGRRAAGMGLCQQHLLRMKRKQPLGTIRQWGQAQVSP